MTTIDTLIDDLENAHATVNDIDATIDDIGEDRLNDLNDRYQEFTTLLKTYKESASGTGRETFQEYVAFQGELDAFESALPSNALKTDVFKDAIEYLDQRRLNQGDFEEAHAILAPIEDRLAIIEDREKAREEFASAKRAIQQQIDDLDDEIERLERALSFENVDFTVSVDQLRSLIDSYNTAISTDFSSFKSNAPAHDFIQFIEKTTNYPLVAFPSPPSELIEYLESADIGNEPLPHILEYTDYTRSKLSHYVDDPSTFNARIAANQTYLDRLSPSPLTISWPPPPQEELHWILRELISVVNRIATSDTMKKLNTLQNFAHKNEYSDIRRAAKAESVLDDTEKERLASGELTAEHEAKQQEKDKLQTALSTYSLKSRRVV